MEWGKMKLKGRVEMNPNFASFIIKVRKTKEGVRDGMSGCKRHT